MFEQKKDIARTLTKSRSCHTQSHRCEMNAFGSVDDQRQLKETHVERIKINWTLMKAFHFNIKATY